MNKNDVEMTKQSSDSPKLDQNFDNNMMAAMNVRLRKDVAGEEAKIEQDQENALIIPNKVRYSMLDKN